jgi:hypothetical protein|tara:strand:+ start:1453 stop:1938 length:486 start_codon:yes stop_codon:yes gene_type:complete
MAYLFVEKVSGEVYKAALNDAERDSMHCSTNDYNIIDVTEEEMYRVCNTEQKPVMNEDRTVITSWVNMAQRRTDGTMDWVRNADEGKALVSIYIQELEQFTKNCPNHPRNAEIQNIIDNLPDMELEVNYGSGTEEDPFKTMPIWKLLSDQGFNAISPLRVP